MRRRAPPPGCVMECHDPHAGSSYPVAGSCIRSVLPRIPLLRLRGRAGVGGRLSAQRGVSRASPAASAGAQAGPHPASPASGRGACPAAVPSRRSSVLPHPACRSFIPFRSTPFRPPRRRFVPCGGTLIRAYPARAPAPAGARVGAGAVRAPDCPRPRDARTQDAPVPSAPQGLFGAGAHRSGLRTPPRPDPYRHQCSGMQALIQNYF